MAREKSDLFIWLGDNIYIDKKSRFPMIFNGAEEEDFVKGYNSINLNHNYTILKNSLDVVGIVDDHDFGKNNGNKHYKNKEISKKHFLNFIEEPKDCERWDVNKGEESRGIYDSYLFGENTNRTVQVVMLDNRFNFDSNSFLGKNQWKWLENLFHNTQPTPKVTIIGSGIQVLPTDKLYQGFIFHLLPFFSKFAKFFFS
eukprot:TRINITY_DN4236_c0_g1_i2.p1 TRINITY_DN4236_c0_g1~~TRINITY_DN4236_c0_g1_i2.p1  ORF type:complete len:199 (+),score=35.98 TRINITY_DN4236_c0_g1_i2:186-782(+)